MPDHAAAPRGGEERLFHDTMHIGKYGHFLEPCEPSNSGKAQWRCAACGAVRQIGTKQEYDPCAPRLRALEAERDRLAGEVERLQVSEDEWEALMAAAIYLDHEEGMEAVADALRALATRLGGGSRE